MSLPLINDPRSPRLKGPAFIHYKYTPEAEEPTDLAEEMVRLGVAESRNHAFNIMLEKDVEEVRGERVQRLLSQQSWGSRRRQGRGLRIKLD